MKARVFVPATIGNVGPGFDVLGLAIDGLGDHFTVELVDAKFNSRIIDVTGRDAALIPRTIQGNCTAIAALAMLKSLGDDRAVHITIERRLPISGGLGGSAAASVGGALAALEASGQTASNTAILQAALEGEASVAGRHLDNIAPAFFGGLCICRSSTPPDVSRIPIRGSWWLTVVTSTQKLATKTARQVLPDQVHRNDMVFQMAYTASVVAAFTNGDHQMLQQSLIDPFAEPRRGPLIEGFSNVRTAALNAGALAFSISGAGPTLFAISATQAIAHDCLKAMLSAFHPLKAEGHVGTIATQGAHLA